MTDTRPRAIMPLIGMGWYRPEDWERLLQVISDRDLLHDTYAEWLAEAEWAERSIATTGKQVRRVLVDPGDLAGWRLVRGRAVDAKARAEFVADKLPRERRDHIQPAYDAQRGDGAACDLRR